MPLPSQAERAEIIKRVTDEASAFFKANPARQLYAGYLGTDGSGSWAFLVMERSGPFGGYDFTPPSTQFTREQFQAYLNSDPKGEDIMRQAVEKVGGTLRAKRDEMLRDALPDMPASPTTH